MYCTGTQNKGIPTGIGVHGEWGAQRVRRVENGVEKALRCTESRAHRDAHGVEVYRALGSIGTGVQS